MTLAVSLRILLLIIGLASARPFSHIAAYGGDARQLLGTNSEGEVVARHHYPQWLGEGRAPWEPHGSEEHDIVTIPETGQTRCFNLTITRDRLAPDGVSRDMFVVNDQFPGPMIEANWGDMIEITVHNRITAPEEPTSLHWHGMLQRQTPWADGVPGVCDTVALLSA